MKKHTLISATIVAAWLCVTLYLLSIFHIHSGWPAFLVLLFFMESGARVEKLKDIFLGGVVGLGIAWLLTQSAIYLSPTLGLQPAIYLSVFVAVFLIIALKDLSETLFNNYTFCYFTVALIYQQQSTLQWTAVLIGGGLFFVWGIILLSKQVHKAVSSTQKA